MELLLNLLLLLLLPITAIAVVMAKDLIVAALIFSVYSFIMAIVYVQLNAPDVGIAEAAVGAGATTILFIITIVRTERMEDE
ncbi:putative subunit of the Multisubunit Na+/H+ antiporter [Methanonatronarchaeum thermophilum]|uniref:Putative subunit of the Multisubunit Na+/H+ antiporter n=1 Tax=Methanonatronarchaeum thermophilum TaxID=1927129 RepID=A0A1Y3GFU8_9EURY|nr:NADH-quinone oxidoreductase subunit J [Methanonatronarchaeum thermophilum]OUJ19173.1 putative subunit of the Multisubunit Na+/H+ antiporter [Methanonatronarchaeum thermophilum]